jgi:hypothetical protein
VRKIAWPKTGQEAIDRAINAILERLLRFELVGNFFGTPADGQVPTYNAKARQWEARTPGGGSLPTTTKGDLLVHNGSTEVRLPVGVDGYVLTAESSDPEGIIWAAPAASGGDEVLTWLSI